MSDLIEKLKEAEARFESVEAALSAPDIFARQAECTALMKERKNLLPVIEKYRAYKDAEQALSEAQTLREDPEADSELRALAAEEYEKESQRCVSLLDEVKLLLLPRDPNDDKNVIVEIRQGAGGEEAALFAAVLYRMYTMYAAAAGFRTERLGANETELGGFKEISFMVEGEGAYSRLKYESGVHRVQRVP